MTTSSNSQSPSDPRPDDKWLGGDHWDELAAILCPESKQEFGKWLGEELEMLVNKLESHITPNSLKQSLRR